VRRDVRPESGVVLRAGDRALQMLAVLGAVSRGALRDHGQREFHRRIALLFRGLPHQLIAVDGVNG
jgi:hypothetical protein